MLTYSQCQSCGESLLISYVGQESCITCPSTPAEKLCREFVDAIQREDHGEAVRLEKLLNAPPKPVAMGSAALWYASIGWYVLPLKPGEKTPLTRHGLKDASIDPDTIREWFTRWPNANVGIRTGEISGFDVIDIDGPAGFKSIADADLPDVYGRVDTPNGAHLYILPTKKGNKVGILPGVDLRSESGYVVGSPSVVGGRSYAWTVKPAPAIMNGAA